jgi:nicotinate phosphoribosyltransferase
MFAAGCAVSEFGTRRRRSWKIQDIVVDTLKKTSEAIKEGKLTGTSNVSHSPPRYMEIVPIHLQVHLAMKYDLSPIGTIAQ